jgi:excinuclease UvrABC nuclease subunit
MDDADDLEQKLMQRWREFALDIGTLLRKPSYSLNGANLPTEPGVYIIIDEKGNDCYVGKATRSLRDRVLSKHVSGDESHAIQRAYKDQFPDRVERRRFIRDNMRVKWLQVADQIKIVDLERLLIWLLQTRCNRG